MKKFLSNIKGTSSVEFALTIAFYLFVVMFIFEFCRLAVATAYWDLAITESVRIAKNEQAISGNYEEAFRKALTKQKKFHDESTIGYLALLEDNKFDVKVQYVDCDKETECIKNLLLNKFRQPQKNHKGELISPTGSRATLAQYSLTYKYKFMVPLVFIPESWSQVVLNREFVVVQEFERSQFMLGAKPSSLGTNP
ncbi:TadE/TadG family type IV pilus assembly protein [Pasteurella multocida]|uniref:TadE/TadG family type IV pilus assembly protein n=1 Tax=Pasteurella multocida TaxID=747 RepID=UPI00230190E6|nr:TadE family protein [Pasteurella multocida]MDA5608328.1 pilus assembly protein [Pasteurella multocida subsp. multocida]MDA5614571.1 pilus assembly protein [Pasteurella multocida]MDA5625752.1 pilus assembly protein [Pasteurella multocida]